MIKLILKLEVNDVELRSMQLDVLPHAKRSHLTDIIIRKDGKETRYQGDWIKRLKIVSIDELAMIRGGPMSLRIRTKSGEEIDLGKIRQRYAEELACYEGKCLRPVDEVSARNAREDLAVLDALEAALRVKNKYSATDSHDEIHYAVADEALTEVRQVAGVIEEASDEQG